MIIAPPAEEPTAGIQQKWAAVTAAHFAPPILVDSAHACHFVN
jgi:hypothetical protein